MGFAIIFYLINLRIGDLNLPWGWQLYFSSHSCCKS